VTNVLICSGLLAWCFLYYAPNMLVDRWVGANFKITSIGSLQGFKCNGMYLADFGFSDDKALESPGCQGELACMKSDIFRWTDR